MKRSLPDRAFSAAVLLPFAAAIAYLHFRKGAQFDSFIFGSGSWGFGCLLKLILYHGIIRKLRHDADNILRVSALNGLVSGVTELGIALIFFAVLPLPTFWDVIAFGVGIGAIEAVLVATTANPLKGTRLERSAAELEAMVDRLRGGRRFVYGYALPFAERLIAGVIHVGTRGLVYIAYREVDPVPFGIALAAFVVADGVLGYRMIHQGKLTELGALNRLYLALAGIAGPVLAGFLLYWPEGGY